MLKPTHPHLLNQSLSHSCSLLLVCEPVFLWPLTYSTSTAITPSSASTNLIFQSLIYDLVHLFHLPCPTFITPPDARLAPLTLELTTWVVQELLGDCAKRGVNSFITSVLPRPSR